MQLPHRPPFLFIDEIVRVQAGVSARCAKTFAAEDPIFQGHFPGNPLVPGVLLVEALAQTSGLILGVEAPRRQLLLAAIRNVKFPEAAYPNEKIDLTSSFEGGWDGLFRFEVSAQVSAPLGEKVVASGQLLLIEKRL